MTAQTTSIPPAELFLTELNPDDANWFLGAPTWIRAASAQTRGAFGLVEQVVESGFASPYHVHHNEDESFYVIEGQVRFISEGRSWVADAGGFAFLPRDVPHGFRIEGSGPARVLLLMTPGGFEGFVGDLSEQTPPAGPPDMDKLMQTAARYGIDILGPLPE